MRHYPNYKVTPNYAHLFIAPYSAWENAALFATLNNREWFWLDDRTSIYTN